MVILKQVPVNHPYNQQKLTGHVNFSTYIGSSKQGKPMLQAAAAVFCREQPKVAPVTGAEVVTR